ncbi:hypothetical protein [Heyndrickxia sporothermodurans]|uniref:hypothetical protein n=1 Tax=Heyndrickxia sporothermodurans TaxID=46224 RepID=UPI002E1AB3E2|nr:hypothetical protein [Heyndrickxia sporothermodurans]MED3697384.1 hypothetical protein [Heyndrickxia sporothermodurans]
MKFADHLSKDSIRKFNQLRRAARNKKEKPKQKKEKVNWHDIMGTNRDTFKRVRGRVRRK